VAARFPFLMLRDAAIAALVAGLLGLPLIGFRLLDQSAGEGLTTRWPEFAAAVVLVFSGRLTLSLIDDGAVRLALLIASAFAGAACLVPWPSQFLQVAAVGGAAVIALRAAVILAGPRPVAAIGSVAKPVGWLLPWLLAGFALILPVLPFANRGVIDAGILILTYILLGWGLNIVTGLAGLLDLGYVAFLAIGAYTTAILSTRYGLSFWMCLPFCKPGNALSPFGERFDTRQF
jgi:branched-chain amino acid transport system permease protein